MPCKLEQEANAPLPMLVTDAGMVTFVRLMQQIKAPPPMDRSPLPSFRFDSAVQ